MNRIKLSPLATHSPAETITETPKPNSHSPNLFKSASEEHSLFVPLHYEKKYAYPLIIWLHSDGQSANQIQDVMLGISMRNYVAVAPQSLHGNSRNGYFWDQDWDTIEHAQHAVDAAIDLASQRCNINHDRIFIAGMGSGGTMAFRLGFSRPHRFAGVMSIHGPLPTDQSPLRDWSRCRSVPIYWTHGRTSTDFDQDLLCRQLRLLHIAGFNVSLRQYPDSQSTCPQMMADMNRWIMEMIATAVR
jgi:phospholipase/carboxylesterase